MRHTRRHAIALVVGLGLLGGCPGPAPYTLVQVVGRNYSYGVPPVLHAGRVGFQFVNLGTVTHEFQIFRFTHGVSADSALRMLAADAIPDAAAERSGAILVGAAGDTVRQLLLDSLQVGDVYGLLCEFRDSAEAPKHSTLGMYAVVRVE